MDNEKIFENQVVAVRNGKIAAIGDAGVWRAIEAGYATIYHFHGFVESLMPETENTTEQ